MQNQTHSESQIKNLKEQLLNKFKPLTLEQLYITAQAVPNFDRETYDLIYQAYHYKNVKDDKCCYSLSSR